MNDAGDLAFELVFDGDDEAVAANGNEVVLGAAAFAQATQRFAETLFNRPVLPFHRSANTAKLRGGIVVQASVRFDLAAQEAEERSEVVIEKRRRKSMDAGPFVASAVGWWIDQIAPGSDTLDDIEQVADLGGFESRPIDTSLVEEDSRVEDAAKLEAAAAGEHGAQFGGALLLLVDPGEVGAGFEREHPRAAKGREGAVGDVVAKTTPFQG